VRDLTGKRFGRLTAQWPIGRRRSGKSSQVWWLCLCSCGGLVFLAGATLSCGHTQSCGCLRREIAPLNGCNSHTPQKHGHALQRNHSQMYNAWSNMIQRCTNPRSTRFADYGGRGISICEHWLNSFENFLADMGVRPGGKTLDRKSQAKFVCVSCGFSANADWVGAWNIKEAGLASLACSQPSGEVSPSCQEPTEGIPA
jgi:hypothetical protein